MVTMVAVGVLFLAGGPSLAIWLVMLQRRAHLLVIAILSAFTWCVSMMLAGTIWHAIPPWKELYGWIVFVIISAQELSRFGLFSIFRLLARRGDGVEAFLRPGAKNELLSGFAVGVGFALMSVLVQFYSLVADEFSDDTAIYTDNCPQNFFVASALLTLAYSVLHICLAIYVWPAYSADQPWRDVFVTYAVHLGISQLSLLNRVKNGCQWNFGICFLLVIVIAIGVVFAARGRLRKEVA